MTSSLSEEPFYLLISKPKLAKDAKHIWRGKFVCSHINWNHSLHALKITNIYSMISFTFPVVFTTAGFQQANKPLWLKGRDILRHL
jgi:hypothetical protein